MPLGQSLLLQQGAGALRGSEETPGSMPVDATSSMQQANGGRFNPEQTGSVGTAEIILSDTMGLLWSAYTQNQQRWNSIINTFRANMPVGRHRRFMRSYSGCFVASEAVDWLHVELQNNPNIRPRVTRGQTIQLLQKLHHAQIIEDVRGSKYDREEFTDSGRLFRFVQKSPKKPAMRKPLGTNLALMNTPSSLEQDEKFKKQPWKPAPPLAPAPAINLLPALETTPENVQDIWKTMALKRLQNVLSLTSLEPLLEPELNVNGAHIRHNMNNINKNGMVNNIPKEDQLPVWMLNAMRTLAHWPEPVVEGITYYPNFEQTVFSLIQDHFHNYTEPLVTYTMYELFCKTFVCAETGRLPGEQDTFVANDAALLIGQSVENLMLDLTLKDEESSPDPNFKPFSTMPALGQRGPEQTFSAPPPRVNDAVTVPAIIGGPSMWSIESQSLGSQHRCLSLNDVNYVPPFEDNELARQERVLSWVTSHADIEGIMELPGLRPPTPPRRTAASTRGVQQARTTYDSSQSNTQRMTQSTRDVRLNRSQSLSDPPPYKPPPTYDSVHCTKPDYDSPDFAQTPWFEAPESYPPERARPGLRRSNTTLVRQSTHQPLGRERARSLAESARSLSKSTASLSLSYRMAMGSSEHTPEGGSIFSALRADTDPSPLDMVERLERSLQVCCLFLPPANRRKLHLLLRLMWRITNNKKLQLRADMDNRQLMLQTFSSCVMRSQDSANGAPALVEDIVAFLMDHHQAVLAVPTELRVAVEERLRVIRDASVSQMQSHAASDSSNLTYCQQVSMEEYESQRMSSSQRAIADLLDDVVKDSGLSQKAKQKRLKQFQDVYPEIYRKYFSALKSKSEPAPPRPLKKAPVRPRTLKQKNIRF